MKGISALNFHFWLFIAGLLKQNWLLYVDLVSLLNSPISSDSFLYRGILGLVTCKIVLPDEDSDSGASALIWLLCISLSWLISLARTSVQCWEKRWEQTCLSCPWSWQESVQAFTIKSDVCCGFPLGTLYQVEKVPFTSSFIYNFYHKSVVDFVKCFLQYLLKWSYGFHIFFY